MTNNDNKKEQRRSDRARIKRILGYLFRYRLVFFAGIVVTLLFGATETLVPWVMYILLDPQQTAAWIPVDKLPFVLPLMLITLFLVRGVLGFIRIYWGSWLYQTMARDLRGEMADKLVRLPKAYHDRETSGILLSRLMQFIEQMMGSTINLCVVLFQDLARLVGYLTTMFLVEWRFTLVALVALPITAVVIGMISRRIRRFSGYQASAASELTGSFGDTIQGHMVVKTYGGEQREVDRLKVELAHLRGIGLRQGAAMALNMPLSQLFVAIALALILGLLAAALTDGALSEGEVGTFIFAMVLLPLPLRSLSRLAEQLQVSLAASKQVFDLLDSEPEPSGGTHAPAKINGKINFAGVDFAYPTEADEQVLTEINFDIAVGEKVALVGPSGSGKSTLTNLLLSFYRPTAGSISLDGVDLREWSLDALRAGIGIVTQDVILFNTTIAENVAYPDTGDQIDMPRLEKALQAAQADRIVANQVQGLNTQLGERGLRLSGGERQRLSIARAFYKDAPILLLDEATSALDAETEKSIRDVLVRLLEGRTALIIAHRMVTVELASRIIVLDHGAVSAAGTHAQLMDSSPLYRRLHQYQQLADSSDKPVSAQA